MHEYDITKNIVNIVLKEAQKSGAKKVKTITLVIGELSGIIDECIQIYFDILSEGTPCEGAKLEFRKIKAQLECKRCKKLFNKNNSLTCPYCGDFGKLTDRGKEFYIDSIEVE